MIKVRFFTQGLSMSLAAEFQSENADRQAEVVDLHRRYQAPYEPVEIRKRELEGSIGGIFGIGGMDVRVIHFEPAESKHITDPVPIGLNAGWWGTDLAYVGLGAALARRGKPAFTIDDGGSFGMLGDIDPRNYAKVPEIASKVAWMATKLVQQMRGYDEVDMYGHSMGGQTATDVLSFILAQYNLSTDVPRPRALVIDGSCGADEHGLSESFDRSRRFTGGELRAKRQDLAKVEPGLQRQTLRRAGRNPLRTLVRGLDAGSTNLYDRLYVLGNGGILRGAIQSERDVFSPADPVERDSGDVLDHLRRRLDPESGHLDPVLKPEATADDVMYTLDALLHQRPEDITAAA